MPAPARKANSAVTAVFVQEKETKNAVRYEEETENGKDPVIGTYFYIKKSLFEKLGAPEAIEVSVKAASE